MESQYFVIAIFIIIAFLLGIPFRKLYSPKRKGAKGEKEVARLLRRLSKKQYIVLNDIYIKANDRSTQIDHLVISTQGIFVIETKNYDGWIHGHEKSQYWTQSFYKKKISFRNPASLDLQSECTYRRNQLIINHCAAAQNSPIACISANNLVLCTISFAMMVSLQNK